MWTYMTFVLAMTYAYLCTEFKSYMAKDYNCFKFKPQMVVICYSVCQFSYAQQFSNVLPIYKYEYLRLKFPSSPPAK